MMFFLQKKYVKHLRCRLTSSNNNVNRLNNKKINSLNVYYNTPTLCNGIDQHNLITMSTDSITIKIISLNVYYNTYKLCNDIWHVL